MIDEMRIPDAHVDTGSSFSIMSSALYDRLPTRPAINSFEHSPRYPRSRPRECRCQKSRRGASAYRWIREGKPAARRLKAAVRDVDRHGCVVTARRELLGM